MYTKVVYVFTKLYDAQAQKCLMIYDIEKISTGHILAASLKNH